MSEYIRLPGIIEAVQLRSDNMEEIKEFFGISDELIAYREGDYVIKNKQGYKLVEREEFEEMYRILV